MSCSLIQTANQASQIIPLNGIIPLGTTIRRYGCNIRLIGDGIEIDGEGYYKVNAAITVEPDTIGAVSVSLHDNGLPIQGAIATGYASVADTPVTLPIITTIRKGCCCSGASNLTLVLTEGAGNVTNVSLRVDKD